MKGIALGRSRGERVAVVALIASFLALAAEVTWLAPDGGFSTIVFSAALLSLSQLVAVTAFVRAPGRFVKAVGLIGGVTGFVLSVTCARHVFTSTSSTAGVALIFLPIIACASLCAILLIATLGERLARAIDGSAK